MAESSPFLTLNYTILWLKFGITAATLAFLWFRYRAQERSASFTTSSLRMKVGLGLVVVFSFGVFHNLGTFRGGTFIHQSEMFHYYLGSKYFEELGYYELYNATIVADAEQGSALASCGAWMSSVEPMTEEDAASVVHNPTPSML